MIEVRREGEKSWIQRAGNAAKQVEALGGRTMSVEMH